jgi:SAM-dependent methyltransferase
MQSPLDLQDWFGGIDIYLFDQLLKGRLPPETQLLDAGCGSGRNLIYFLRTGYSVFGVDQSSETISYIRRLTATLAPNLPAENFRVEAVEQMSFIDSTFDAVISSAVLHFAVSEDHWQAMVAEMWRVLKPGGIFFARLASNIGIENQVRFIEGRRYHLPDGSDRFLVDEPMLMKATTLLGGEFIDPLKTVVVQNMRAMSTWCLRKSLRNGER